MRISFGEVAFREAAVLSAALAPVPDSSCDVRESSYLAPACCNCWAHGGSECLCGAGSQKISGEGTLPIDGIFEGADLSMPSDHPSLLQVYMKSETFRPQNGSHAPVSQVDAQSYPSELSGVQPPARGIFRYWGCSRKICGLSIGCSGLLAVFYWRLVVLKWVVARRSFHRYRGERQCSGASCIPKGVWRRHGTARIPLGDRSDFASVLAEDHLGT